MRRVDGESRIVRRIGDASDVPIVSGGTYLLVYAAERAIEPNVGALGSTPLPAGGYVYVGSALGTGGFSRIDRHERVAAGDHEARHWHVDYLGGHDAVSLVADRRLPNRDVECRLASQFNGDRAARFGASDCDCSSHLVGYADPETALAAADRARATVAADEE